MSCYHPLKAFRIGTTAAGKADLKIVPYQTDHVELIKGRWTPAHTSLISQAASDVVRDFIEIPCGKCLGCRLEYSRQWADRCMLELQYHDSSYFVTLTYDDANVPYSVHNTNPDWTGDVDDSDCRYGMTLRKSDFQKFMKRLRKNSGQDLRYFMCGEYGTDTLRPHYHAIIFGLQLSDLQPYKKSPQGFDYYNSEFLSSCWPYGFAVVCEVTWETCAYVARYVMKKQTDGRDSDFYESFNLEPEFTLMSRRPGLARPYYDAHPDLYKYDKINISTFDGGRALKPPRYFDKLYDLDDHSGLLVTKANRQFVAENSLKQQLSGTDLSYLELLQVKENNKASSVKALKRGDF